jgi:methionine sulfoxide reductase catalytic subunit
MTKAPFVRIPRAWELSEREVTEESLHRKRREIIKSLGLAAGASLLTIPNTDSSAATAGFPTRLNKKYFPPKGTKLTEYKYIKGYNNFYEFTTDKYEVASRANLGWKTEPWTIQIGGHVEKPLKFDVNDLVKEVGIEQRVYRFRCVEAWSMVIPWDGFQLNKLIAKAKPTSKAKFVMFSTFKDEKTALGLRNPNYDWPYTEGLRMDEAMHELTFLATGIYGKPIPHQNGAPIRLVVPWKYGFKSIKSIVRIDFTDKKPKTLWNTAGPDEYGFYSNVNPEVNHPRWSQASERIIGGGFGERIPTLKFNGYEKEVAHLYKGMDLRKFF